LGVLVKQFPSSRKKLITKQSKCHSVRRHKIDEWKWRS